MSRPAYARLAIQLDLRLLREALADVDGRLWLAHFNRDYFHGDWSGVVLISAADAVGLAPGHEPAVQRAPWLDDPRWQRALEPLPVDIVSARLLRLGPGSQILQHCDHDLQGPQADLRLHIALLSPPEVDFMLDGQRMPMAAGECWYLDLARPHSVDNRDTRERIHLVLDCRPSPWLEQAIHQGLPSTPAPGLGQAAAAFERFRQWVDADPHLCRRLQGETDVQAFITLSVNLAAERGLVFGPDQVRAAMTRGRRQWQQQWSP
ncbi:aspartyl/asparaginyl beta-hydroxylase domain-containing protein [Pseudomonas sp. LD120]|uniref:aspartyl/asparaginyl beta-hydroxylase domain-containing protein n=1 Tax=Pseudomonas sp. LD120 TaxID=485751 RepID=UPI00135851B4|nr:aspartyl/asparaginyl beta-hydroxylase domain-containing protein [Pseudomonas sp. LD120]KAF0864783.1 aspartyl beta-hydroxylase [Pseudomonas sp. LD120]